MGQQPGSWGPQQGGNPQQQWGQQQYGQAGGYGAPQQWNGATGQQAPVASLSPVAPRKRLVVGPLLMIVTPIMLVAGLLMPWYIMHVKSTGGMGVSFGQEDNLNGVGVLERVMSNGYMGIGLLLMLAFILAVIGSIGSLIAGVMAIAAGVKGRGVGVTALICAIVGLVGTLGVLIFYFMAHQTRFMAGGVWVYGLSFLPALLGSIGVFSKKF